MVAMVLVRPAVPADARQVATVHVASWRSAYADLLPARILADLSVDDRAAVWAERLSDPDNPTAMPVAVDEGVFGFAVVGPSQDEDADPSVGGW
jgi:hypothetical protein